MTTKKHSPRFAVRARAGFLCLALAWPLLTAHAAQEANPGLASMPQEVIDRITDEAVRVDLSLSVDGSPATPYTIVSPLGSPISFTIESAQGMLALAGTVTRADDGLLQLAAEVRQGGKVLSSPVVRVHPGASGEIRAGGSQQDGSRERVVIGVTMSPVSR